MKRKLNKKKLLGSSGTQPESNEFHSDCILDQQSVTVRVKQDRL